MKLFDNLFEGWKKYKNSIFAGLIGAVVVAAVVVSTATVIDPPRRQFN